MTEDAQKVRFGRVGLSLVLVAVFVVFAIVAPVILPGKFDSDSDAMLMAAEDLLHVDSSFQVMANIINVFGYNFLTVVVIASSAVIVFNIATVPRRVETFAFAVFSLAAAAPLWMVRPQKEMLVVLLTAACLTVMRRVRSPFFCLIAISVLYFLYAFEAGRIYYYITPLVFGLLFLISAWPIELVATTVLLAPVALFAAPSRLMVELSQARNVLNFFVVLNGTVNTAFLNPVQGNSVVPFLENYLYAAIRLNFPIIFNVRAQELFLTVFSMIWLRLIWAGWRSSAMVPRMAACLILAHMTVEWIFEPDLGSYLRHLSSTLVLIIPLIEALDDEKFRRYRLLPRSRLDGGDSPTPLLLSHEVFQS